MALKENSKLSRVEVIFSLVNSMIGGTILILPLLFRKQGYFASIVTSLLMGLASYKTACIYIENLEESDRDDD
jgi:sodium-coupled neutral amino acid transporter 9